MSIVSNAFCKYCNETSKKGLLSDASLTVRRIPNHPTHSYRSFIPEDW